VAIDGIDKFARCKDCAHSEAKSKYRVNDLYSGNEIVWRRPIGLSPSKPIAAQKEVLTGFLRVKLIYLGKIEWSQQAGDSLAHCVRVSSGRARGCGGAKK
jgi:hypothetical protein